jgi:dihydropyrimidinase
MPDLDLVIRNGTVVTAEGTKRCDVGVRAGTIAALGEVPSPAARTIDASDRLVLPGGIDAHCHIAQTSSAGIDTADDFETGTRSAACGGTTTIVPFAAQHRGQSLRDVVAAYHERARHRALVDYAFHLIVSDPTPAVLDEDLPALVAEGCTSLKIYMTYDSLRLDDRQLLAVLTAARRLGAMVMVHAENHDLIAWQTSQLLETGCSAPKFHALAHSAAAENEATHRAVMLAEAVGVPLLVVHVSNGDAAEHIRKARARGARIHGETCPQYLFLTADDMDRPGFEGAKYMCSPPPRDAAAQQSLWQRLQDGTIEVFSSDHAPYRYDDPRGKKLFGEDASFDKIINGLPGIELRMPLLFSAGVHENKLSLEQFVAVTATNPARIYGLFPRKGAIAIGSDADLAIWDPAREVTVTADVLHDNMDYTPYEGRRVRGWPVCTISRGDIVCDLDGVYAEPGRGCFLPRSSARDGSAPG